MNLKKCPFCGKLPDLTDPDTLYPSGIVYTETDFGRNYGTRKEIPNYDGQCWSLNCVEIAGGCGVEMTADSKEEAISKWEKRK